MLHLSERDVARLGTPHELASKYRNVRTRDATGVLFDSRKELRIWDGLQLRQRAGEIRELRRQVPFPLHAVNLRTGEVTTICTYVADFSYSEYHARQWRYVVADVKGWKTLPMAKLKQKILAAEYGLTVQEIRP